MSFKHLTIGKKITLGFGLIFALLAIVAGIAYTALGGAGQRLAKFSDSAQETYAAATLESSMQTLKLRVNEFLATGSAESIAACEAAKQVLDADLDSAAKLMVEPSRAAEIAKARELLATYRAAFADLVTNHKTRTAVESDVLNTQSKIIADGLQTMLAQAKTQGDMNAAFNISSGLKAFFEGTSLVNGFLLTADPVKAEAARKALGVTAAQIQKMEKDQLEMEKLDATLKDEAKTKLIASLQTATAAYVQGIAQVVEIIQARDRILAERINRVAPEFTAALVRVKGAVHTFQTDLETSTRAEQRRNEYVVSLITLVGMAIGAVFAWLIIRSVTAGITGIADRLASESGKAHASATQVADASQAMASGAAQQAASLEETSSSLHEMASMTSRNSENAQNAKTLANQTRTTADAGAVDMEQMKAAMSAIKASSVEISKIIKTIDEIAFQTNILALNAAVEADEVRNLAQRCAGAAKETADKISASTEKSEQGVRISEKMAANLSAIVEKTRQLDERIGEIAQSSHEQSEGIGQLNSAVASMDKITQDNAVLAQQSADSGDELKQQAQQVRQAVAELLRMAQGGDHTESEPEPEPAHAAVSRRAPARFEASRFGLKSPKLPFKKTGYTLSSNGSQNVPAAQALDGAATAGADDLSFRD
jgi:methyl-accepting chemotaxis protein